MLGPDRPGSEGNLASDIENQDQAVNPAGDVDVAKAETPRAEASKPESTKNDVPKGDGAKPDAPPKRTRATEADKHHAEPKDPKAVPVVAPAVEAAPAVETKAPVPQAAPTAVAVEAKSPARETNPSEGKTDPGAQPAGQVTSGVTAAPQGTPQPAGRMFDQRRRAVGNQGPKSGNALDLVELKDMSIQNLNTVAKD